MSDTAEQLRELETMQKKGGEFVLPEVERLYQEGLRNRRAVTPQQATPPAQGLTSKEEADLRTVCEHTPGSDFEKIKGKMESDPKGLAQLRRLNASHGKR
jgi:hypothetical protein